MEILNSSILPSEGQEETVTEPIKRNDLFAVEEIVKLQENIYKVLKDTTLKQEPVYEDVCKPELFDTITKQLQLLYEAWGNKGEEIELSQNLTSSDINWTKDRDSFYLGDPNEGNTRINIDKGHNDVYGWNFGIINIHNYHYPPFGIVHFEQQNMDPSIGIYAGDLTKIIENNTRTRLIFGAFSHEEKHSREINMEFDMGAGNNMAEISATGEEILKTLQKDYPPEVTSGFSLIGIRKNLSNDIMVVGDEESLVS